MPSSLTARSRKSSFANPTASPPGPGGHVPTTFFLANEAQMEDAVARQPVQSRHVEGAGSGKGDKGVVAEKVQSIEDALTAAFGVGGEGGKGAVPGGSESVKSGGGDGAGDAAKKRKRRGGEEMSAAGEAVLSGSETPRHGDSTSGGSPQPVPKLVPAHTRRLSGGSASTPLTPINVDSPAYQLDSGIPSTPKSVSLRSLRLSDDGEHDEMLLNDAASQAVASTDDEDEMSPQKHHHADSVAPELVMPSIAMPSRRPFTANGKRLGRLRLVVAGRSGIGKTGLIRSIVQLCEDIVHVDPVTKKAYSLPHSDSTLDSNDGGRNSHSSSRNEPNKTSTRTKQATEVFMSTRAYPSWWSDNEGSRVLRRRKSMGVGDTILERNLTFVDTIGYEVEELAESLLVRNVEGCAVRSIDTVSMSESEVLHMISGRGSLQVDAVLFMFGKDFDPEDLRICKRLDEMTNIIPLLGRADEMGEAEIQQWKVDLCEKMSEHEIKPFTFKRDVESQMASSVPQPETTSNTASLRTEDEAAEPDPVPPEASQQHDRKVYAPFAVSSAPGLDNDTMDASLLMSSDYCPPPVPSELQDLVQMMFDPENAAWLRHSSARKVVAWQRARLVRRMESGMPHDTWRSRLVGNVSSNGKVERRLSPRGTKSSASGKAAVPKWAANLQEAMRHEHARRGWSNEDELLKKMQNKSARPPKSKRHWSEASTSSSTQTLTASGEQRFDIIERVSSVTWSALRIVSIVGAVGVTACVVARRCFGIESVTIGWDWR